MSADSATDAWTSGNLSFLHWNGTSWSSVTTKYGAGFPGISADSTTDAWAVGSQCINTSCSPVDTITPHWNGTTWTRK